MKFIRRMDEMEMDISLKSMRWSYLFTLLVLAAWAGYSCFTGGNWQLPLYTIIGQNLINFGATLFYRRQMDDEGWKHDVRCMLMILAVILLAGLAIPLFLIATR
ncbi:hypothetical protein [Bacilliculturomica massiliensis]|uniref:hypothetical protein n=1 Tax=Bacilliculturomica massiliensis TaxID=1917867 RepID=UPI001031541C|nr:hypothetical protein [Bacilliculturomica massiliensis]